MIALWNQQARNQGLPKPRVRRAAALHARRAPPAGVHRHHPGEQRALRREVLPDPARVRPRDRVGLPGRGRHRRRTRDHTLLNRKERCHVSLDGMAGDNRPAPSSTSCCSRPSTASSTRACTRAWARRRPTATASAWAGTATATARASTTPSRCAWGDANLRELAGHIESPLFLAHVRAAIGSPVQQTNCHPFRRGNWLFALLARHHGDGFALEVDVGLAADVDGDAVDRAAGERPRRARRGSRR